MKHRSTALILAIAALAGLSACTGQGYYGATHHERHHNASLDGDLAARVQARIHADQRQALRATVTVNAFNGMVELLGEARTAEERQMAEALAQQTYGVAKVKNLMTLRR